MFVKGQFLDSCPSSLAIHLKEQAPKSLDDLAATSDHYLHAHNMSLRTASQKTPWRSSLQSGLVCFNSKQPGHKAVMCPNLKDTSAATSNLRCFICDKSGHLAKDCRSRELPYEKKQSAAAASLKVKERRVPVDEPMADIRVEDDFPIAIGMIEEKSIKVLRDTGCNGVVVRRDLVQESQLTGKVGCLTLLDRSVIEAPIAKININTPFYMGQVEALCIENPLHDLVLGNIPGARPPSDAVPITVESQASAVVTRARSERQKEPTKPLKVAKTSEWPAVSRKEFEESQNSDKSLDKLRSATEEKERGKGKSYFGVKDNLLYRFFWHPNVNGGKVLKQLVVPTQLRFKTMEIAHETMMSGHLGIKKTSDRILSNFFWPGLKDDVRRFGLSCDICQRTLNKGSVPKIPLQKTPIIDTPFKRVAVDLVGPIHPPSSGGHRYILTLIDYATRYPEAIALKNIATEDVAQGLLTIYSRIVFPEEILSDMGSQFVSDCMKEVERLLNIKHLSTTPYNPQCNGLVEKFNGTLKSMLRKLCVDQPREWHRYLDALLFAYREVPQESTGFAPFELLYGRSVRGPIHILRKMWSAEVTEPEVLSSYRYVFDLQERLEDMFAIVNEEASKSQARYKVNYDSKNKVKQRKFQPGDFVLLLLPTDQNKLLMHWKGPFKVIEAVGPADYKIEVNNKVKLMHANCLKKYYVRTAGDCVSASCAQQVLSDNESDKSLNETDFLPFVTVERNETVDMIEIDGNLSDQQKAEISALLQQFEEIFSDVPGCTNLIEHEINLTSDVPVRSKPYTVPFSMCDGLKRDIEAMISNGIIQPSSSPYASPVVLVKKKDGSNRFCVDYRRLNKITLFDPEPMTTNNDVFEKLSNDRYFTTIDLTKGYWQIPVAECDVAKTAFVTHEGTYEFLRMPFGMVNSSATFVRAMRKMLKGINNVQVYIDDVIVHTRDWESHIEVLKCLFGRFREVGMTIKPSKCVVGASKVDFLGHNVGDGVIGLHESNVAKITNASKPRTKKEVRSFLGLTRYYRDYNPHYAAIAAPLSDLTRKGKPNVVIWDAAEESAFNALKCSLTCAPILKLPDTSKPFVLRCDASNIGIGAVLLQYHDGELFPVSYASKKLSDTEKRYSTIERECSAIVWAIKKSILCICME